MDEKEPRGVRIRRAVLRTEKALAKRLFHAAPAIGVLFALLLGFGAWVYFGLYQPSDFFPVRTVITIPEGSTLQGIAATLEAAQVIRSDLAFITYVMVEGGANRLQAGDYYFDHKLSLGEVADRLITGQYGLTPLTITIPEGATTYQMADIFAKKLDRFDPVTFLTLAQEKEGYLFPDTYQFLPNADASTVLDLMERTFYSHLTDLEPDIAKFGHPVHEVVTMASLLEKEATDFEQKRTIAGVLWHRLEIGMPLQVDAVFGFIKRSDTFSPRYSDLKVESPYNTYQNGGLPPGPIGNPGLDSIRAAVTPVETDALFYLHGRDGTLHASRTYKEHLANKRSFLD